MSDGGSPRSAATFLRVDLAGKVRAGDHVSGRRDRPPSRRLRRAGADPPFCGRSSGRAVSPGVCMRHGFRILCSRFALFSVPDEASQIATSIMREKRDRALHESILR